MIPGNGCKKMTDINIGNMDKGKGHLKHSYTRVQCCFKKGSIQSRHHAVSAAIEVKSKLWATKYEHAVD